jgi:hypothetical protein
LVPRDDEVLERFDQVVSELTSRGVVSSTGYCSYAISSDLMIYVIDFDTAWYSPKTFHVRLQNGGIDYYCRSIFRIEYRIDEDLLRTEIPDRALDADTTFVTRAKEKLYSLKACKCIAADGVDMI